MPRVIRIWIITMVVVVGVIVGIALWETWFGASDDDGPWPETMGLTRCPPQPVAQAAGYQAGSVVHPAVIVVARSKSAFQAPDRIQWLATGWPGPIDWPHPLDWPNHARSPLQVPAAWLADGVAELELVVCVVAVTAADAEVEVCPYEGQNQIRRVRGDVRVVAYDGRTASVIGDQVVVGREPRPCPERHTFGSVPVEVWRGDPPVIDTVLDAVGAFVTPG